MQKYYLLALMLSMGLIISRPAQADQKADKLLEDVKSVLKNAQSFSAQATINTVSGKNSNKQVMIIKMQKPDKAVEITTGKYSSGSLVTQPSEFLARLIATGVEWDGG